MAALQKTQEKNTFQRAWINILILIIVFGGYTIYSLTGGSRAVSFSFQEDQLLITDPGGESVTIPYRDITGLELIEEHPEYGEEISGQKTRSWQWGEYRNDTWGNYYLYVRPSVDACIVISSEEGTVVINSESDSVTRAMYEDMNGFIEVH